MIIKNYFRTLLEAEFAAGADFEHDSDLGTSLYEIVSFTPRGENLQICKLGVFFAILTMKEFS